MKIAQPRLEKQKFEAAGVRANKMLIEIKATKYGLLILKVWRLTKHIYRESALMHFDGAQTQ